MADQQGVGSGLSWLQQGSLPNVDGVMSLDEEELNQAGHP